MNDRYLLLLLGSTEAGKPFTGAVKLVKAIFMAQSEAHTKHAQQNFSYSFYRWDYGPFDSSIYRDIERLKSCGLVDVNVDYSPYPEKSYSLTKEGKTELLKIKSAADPAFKEIVKKWAQKISKMSREDVLKLVYEKSKVSSYEMGDKVVLPDVND